MNRINQFQAQVLEYYNDHGRKLPWREDLHPYSILVSEIMLQQTQVQRVLIKYQEFLSQFPDIERLAKSPLSEVLVNWQGLGYNRRAKYLHTISRIIVENYQGHLPTTPEELEKLPGIGKNTAGSIATFAFNYPSVFIETNIRRVFIHHFFGDRVDVLDAELIPLITESLVRENPRIWYWALMDYGTFLKTQVANPNRRSKHYVKQSKFEGSNRQVRSQILKLFLQHRKLTLNNLKQLFERPDERIERNLQALLQEGILRLRSDRYELCDE